MNTEVKRPMRRRPKIATLIAVLIVGGITLGTVYKCSSSESLTPGLSIRPGLPAACELVSPSTRETFVPAGKAGHRTLERLASECTWSTGGSFLVIGVYRAVPGYTGQLSQTAAGERFARERQNIISEYARFTRSSDVVTPDGLGRDAVIVAGLDGTVARSRALIRRNDTIIAIHYAIPGTDLKLIGKAQQATETTAREVYAKLPA